jgi:hypothetical protein
MAAYRIYRLRESRRKSFRWAPHTSGATEVKPRDYEVDGTAEGPTPYAAWSGLQETDQRLKVGDLLESPEEGLRIFKYVGFEEARWEIPEASTDMEAVATAAGEPAGATEPSIAPN